MLEICKRNASYIESSIGRDFSREPPRRSSRLGIFLGFFHAFSWTSPSVSFGKRELSLCL